MGASNFWRTHLPSGIIYAFAMDSEDEFAYDDTIENVKSELKQKDYFWETLQEWVKISRIDYKVIGYMEVPFYIPKEDERRYKWWALNSYYIVVEHGYYEWARFDIIEDEDNDIDFQNKAYRKRRDKIIRDIEKIFARHVEVKARKVWSFSNWEWVYETIK